MAFVDDQSEVVAADDETACDESPVLVELGVVRQVVLGNSSSGNSDANTQYYW